MSTIEKAVEKLGKKSSGKPKNPDAVDDFIADDFRAEPAPASFVDDAVAIRPDAAQGRVNNKEIIELPLSRLAELGVITPDKPRTQIAEEYRAIKRPLLRNIAGEGAGAIENPNLIMVTSSLEGEGKTFSAVNLMMSMSMESNKTVLFVDADVAKASSSRMLGVSDDAPGLIDVLQHDEIGIEDVLLFLEVYGKGLLIGIVAVLQLHDQPVKKCVEIKQGSELFMFIGKGNCFAYHRFTIPQQRLVEQNLCIPEHFMEGCIHGNFLVV